MECPICYELVTGDKWQNLECRHALCKFCLGRLQKHICPLCREPIIFYEQYFSQNNNNLHFSEIQSNELGRRRRRRRNSERVNHTIPLEIEMLVKNILETAESDRKRQRYRSGKNRWKNNNAHNSGFNRKR